MGLSVSVATAVIFIASIIVFGSLVGAFDEAQHTLLKAERLHTDRQSELEGTSISIVDVNRTDRVIMVLNSGTTTLNIQEIDVFINGTFCNDRITNLEIDSYPNTNIWLPGERLNITISENIYEALLKVVTKTGVSAYL